MDGKLKSKRTGQEWSTPQEYYGYAVSKAATPEQRQSIEAMGPDKVWSMATGMPDKFEVVAPETQPIPASVKPTGVVDNAIKAFDDMPFIGFPELGMIPGVRRSEVMKNAPASAMKAVTGVLTGIPSIIGAVYNTGKEAYDQGSISPIVEGSKMAGGAIADDYRNFYLSGNAAQNIEQDPFRVISDLATVMGGAAGVAKAGKMAAAPGMAKVAAGLDAASLNPMAAIPSSQKIGEAQEKLGELAYRKSLNLPKNVAMPQRKELAKFGSHEGIVMNEAGQAKAGAKYSEASSGMKAASKSAESHGALIDPNSSVSKMSEAVDQFDIDPMEKAYAQRISDRIKNRVFPATVLPNTPGPISPTVAEKVKEKLNKNLEKLQGNRNRINTAKSSIAESVKIALLDGVREAQGHAITDKIKIGGKEYSYKEAGKVANLSKKLEDIAESIVALMDTSSGGTASMTEGAAVGSALRRQAFTPSQIGWLTQYLAKPDIISKLGIELVSASKSGSKKADRLKTASIPTATAARAKSRSGNTQEDPNADEPSSLNSVQPQDEDEPSIFIKK